MMACGKNTAISPRPNSFELEHRLYVWQDRVHSQDLLVQDDQC